jgi:hypothetical protein
MPAYGRLLNLYYFCKAAGQGCRARLPGKAAGQGCQARLPGKAAECMVKLDSNALLLAMSVIPPRRTRTATKQNLYPRWYVRKKTNF